MKSGRHRDLWNEVSRIRASSRKKVVNIVDDQSGEQEICDVFSTKYCQLYNSVTSDETSMQELSAKVESRITRCQQLKDNVTVWKFLQTMSCSPSVS